MSELKQHPDWQKTFRDMQAIRDQRHAEQQAKAHAANVEAERKAGYRLQQALMHFGIYIDPAPQVNLVEVDGYQFKLLGGDYTLGKNATGETFIFDLIVQKPIPGRTDEDDDRVQYRYITVNTTTRREPNWDYELCKLADAFDEIDEAVAFDVARDAERKQRAEEQKLMPALKSETPEEKLFMLFRSLIREEIAKQLEY